jgi:hypothetical protein
LHIWVWHLRCTSRSLGLHHATTCLIEDWSWTFFRKSTGPLKDYLLLLNLLLREDLSYFNLESETQANISERN